MGKQIVMGEVACLPDVLHNLRVCVCVCVCVCWGGGGGGVASLLL